jgi:broad specificity phosphatase PhoE
MRLFLIRHGQSETNVRWDNIVEGRQMNSHLTEVGQEQAGKLAEWLYDKVPLVDAIYASTLHRAQETAVPLEETFMVKKVLDDRIREGGYNYNTGGPIEDDLLPIHKHANFHQYPDRPLAEVPDGVEAYNDLRTRTGQFLSEMIDKHYSQTVIAITHGWTMNAIIDHIFNIGLYRSAYVNVDNTAITYVEYVTGTEFENWRVHFVGQTPHLEVFPGGLASEGWEG